MSVVRRGIQTLPLAAEGRVVGKGIPRGQSEPRANITVFTSAFLVMVIFFTGLAHLQFVQGPVLFGIGTISICLQRILVNYI